MHGLTTSPIQVMHFNVITVAHEEEVNLILLSDTPGSLF